MKGFWKKCNWIIDFWIRCVPRDKICERSRCLEMLKGLRKNGVNEARVSYFFLHERQSKIIFSEILEAESCWDTSSRLWGCSRKGLPNTFLKMLQCVCLLVARGVEMRVAEPSHVKYNMWNQHLINYVFVLTNMKEPSFSGIKDLHVNEKHGLQVFACHKYLVKIC